MKLKWAHVKNDKLKINPVIRFLIYSDIAMMSGWGLLSPIIAVFFTDNIKGGNVELAGLASTVYFIVKSVLQIPVARYIDSKKGENDDYWVMLAGSAIICVTPFLYTLLTEPWHVYAVQVFYGIGGALSYPSWLAIFTRHVDRHEEGFEWSLYYTTIDFGSALTAGLGGFIAARFGYYWVFLLVGISSIVGSAFLAGTKRHLFSARSMEQR